MGNIFVINVGGSLLSPSDEVVFDFDRAAKVKQLVQSFPNNKFILCVGGGKITRKYQTLLEEKGLSKTSEHEVGVALINVNAVMLKATMEDIAEDKILRYEDFKSDSPITFEKQVLISAAGAPGHSSDWNTIKLALRAGEKKTYSLTNIDGVYNKDPKTNPDATLQSKLSWKEYLDIIGNPTEHKPGAKYPVDPLASQLATENGVGFYVLSGDDLENFSQALRGEPFKGTLIA